MTHYYTEIAQADNFKILVSDSISTIQWWSKRTRWCTSDRRDAADHLSAGDCIAFVGKSIRKPDYLMFTNESGPWNQKNDQIKLINFFDRWPEVRDPLLSAFPQVAITAETQKTERAEQHQKKYYSEEFKEWLNNDEISLRERYAAAMQDILSDYDELKIRLLDTRLSTSELVPMPKTLDYGDLWSIHNEVVRW